MVFSFGGSSDANSAAPGASGAGFTFGAPGSGSASAGQSSAPSPGTSPASSTTGPTGGGAFGTSIPSTGPSGNAPSVFGAAQAPSGTTTTFTPATNHPAPATDGGLFGRSAVPTAASGSTGFAFSSSTTSVAQGTTPAPAASRFNFGTASAFGGAPGSGQATQATGLGSAPSLQPTMVVPEFDTVFDNLGVWNAVQRLCTRMGDNTSKVLSGQEIVHYISTLSTSTLQPQIVEWTQPDAGIRQKLENNPVIGLGSASKTVTLTPLTRKRVLLLSTDLRISEAHAVALYEQMSEYADTFQGLVTNALGTRGLVDQVLPRNKFSKVGKLARDFYFFERHLRLETLLYLVKERLESDPNILLATDFLLQNGLVSNLITLIRQYTERIVQLQEEIKANASGLYGQPIQGQQHSMEGTGTSTSFVHLHLLFCQQERQTAVEGLFFVAYHTQLEMSELASMIDLIHYLSNATPTLNPFHDVSSPYEEVNPGGGAGVGGAGEFVSHQFAAPAWPPPVGGVQPLSWHWREKSSLQWQRDLVLEVSQSGQPHIMQCNSLLIVAAMAAMDTGQILYNRDLHGPNSFGRGNMFLPPDRETLDSISVLNVKLNPSASTEWNRKDIWGVLALSYALLLQSSPSVMTSPRKGGSTNHLSKEAREIANDCMIKPTEVMSFTFCRETMIPVLRNLKSSVSEFGLSVLAEVYSHYLSVLVGAGYLPISRKQWVTEEEMELRLRREQQWQQRQFHAWSGNQSQESFGETIPTVVDLMTRPECLDDLIALASDLCSLGAAYAFKFWETNITDGSMVPSKVMLECIAQASHDDSILPCLLSWLASLSNDETSANAVNNLLSNTSDNASESTGGVTLKTNWYTLIYNLRWYAQELTPTDSNNPIVSQQPTTTSTAYDESSSYYYSAEDLFRFGSNSENSTNTQKNGREQSSSSKKSRPKELSEAARFRVASHLALLMNVSSYSVQARYEILSVNLPVGDGGLVAGGDSSLLVLFKLAMAPLTPQIRGATLSTIASLVQPTEGISDSQVKSLLEEQARNAWEYLESSPLLPIALLDQYRSVNTQLALSQDQVGLHFPPSSTTLAGSLPETKSIVPKNPIYGILYEMEHVESKKGWYPSTEGFLDLLGSLVRSVGCPSRLGESFRARSGCTPYFEYILNFVLTRALGAKNYPVLPFRVKGDQSRLVSRALEVVKAVLIQYDLSTVTTHLDVTSSPVAVLGIQAGVKKTELTTSASVEEVANDFKNLSTSAPSEFLASRPTNLPTTSASPAVSKEMASIPNPKSGGFTILFDLLSSTFGTLLNALSILLADDGGPSGIRDIFGQQSDDIRMVYALYGSTPPDLSSAKEGTREGGPTKPLQNLLKPILPKLKSATIDESYFDDGILWREVSVSLTLQILYIASIREGQFMAAIAAAKEPLKLVPVLDFQQTRSGTRLKSLDVRVSRLADLLFAMENSENLRCSLVEYVAHPASDEIHDKLISAAALSIIYHLHQTLPPGISPSALSGDLTQHKLATSVAKRMVIAGKRLDQLDVQLLILILNWILSELRTGTVATNGLAQELLGLRNATFDGNRERQEPHYGGSVVDCFDALLEILEMGYSEPSESWEVSSLCFEVLFRLYNLTKYGNMAAWRITLYTASRLRRVKFWDDSLLRLPLHAMLSSNPGDANKIMHNIAWLLKGLSSELKLLVGFASESVLDSELADLLAPHPWLFDSLLSILFGSEGDQAFMHTLLMNLPLERNAIDPSLVYPSKEALKIAAFAMPGARDVVEGYESLDCTKAIAALTRKGAHADIDATRKWIEEWNLIVERDCAASHLSNSISLVIEGAFHSAHAIASCALDVNGFLLARSQVWLRNGGAGDLLAGILTRLNVDHLSSDHQGMDAFLLPNATRNLSLGVVVLSEFIASDSSEALTSPGDCLRLCSMLSRVVYLSSIGDDAAAEAPLRHERTVSLGGSLAEILQSAPSAEPTIARQYQDDFALAAGALVRISRFKVDSSSSDSRSIAAVLARSSLASIILSLNEVETSSDDQTNIFQFIERPFIESLLALVIDLDSDICNLLRAVALSKNGTRLLIAAGIGHSLKAAALRYCEQESAEIENIKQRGPSFVQSRIRSPFFLISHLQLILALLNTVGGSNDLSATFSLTCMEVLGVYKAVVQRLCFNFPDEADLLHCFVKCLVMTHSASQKKGDGLRGNSNFVGVQDLRIKEAFSTARLLENGLYMLTQQISENPLPRDMLPPFPIELTNLARKVDSEYVNVEKDVSKTWWDFFDDGLKATNGRYNFLFEAPMERSELKWFGKVPDKWNENKFEFSIVAVETLWMGLSLMKRFNRIDLFNESSVARGLFMCAIAAGCVGRRLEDARFRLGNGASIMQTDDNDENVELEVEYLELLFKALMRSVEEFLTLGSMLTGDLKEGGRTCILNQLVIAINASGVKGLPLLGGNSQELVSILCKQIETGERRI